MRARVVVVAGPSGSGKTRLAERVGLPVLRLDDFYRSAGDPALPPLADGTVDWDDPASWLHDDAVSALEELCRTGRADLPEYDISASNRVGHRLLEVDGPLFLAEGIFAQEVVGEARSRGLLADAICLTQPPVVTFWRRLARDLREHRKPPLLLVRRGVRLAREQQDVVAHAVSLGCAPMSADEAQHRITLLAAAARA